MKKALASIFLMGLLVTIGAAGDDKPAAGKKSGTKAAAGSPSKGTTMDAWISDEKCGATIDPDCAQKCAKEGIKLVVVTTADKSVIPVSNQDSIRPFIGKHVTVNGTMQNGELTVAGVKLAKGEKK